MDTENYIAKLNEYIQRTRSILKYEDIRTDGPDHIKTFTIRAVVNDEAYPEGVGNNRKEAKQNAAKYALKKVMEKKEHASECSLGSVSQTVLNHVSWLYEYGQKIKMDVRFIECTIPGSFQCRFLVGLIEYPVATGTTKKEAKAEAAKLAYHAIYEASQSEGEEPSGASSQQEEEMSEICDKTPSSKTEDDGLIEKNCIGNINEYCQRTHRTPNFIEVKRSGPSHNHKFSYKLVIDGKDYPVGAGKTIKEAKQNAAHLALSTLEKEDSEVLRSSTRTRESSMASTLNFRGSPNAASSSFSVQFAESSPQAQGQSPDCKPNRRIAAIFPNSCGQQNQDFKEREGNSERKLESTRSRFEQDFDCIEYIHRGSFGSVYEAKHKLEGKKYAVKIVECKKKSLREIEALSDLQHINIVRYYTCWMEDADYKRVSVAESSSSMFLYIQMELCDKKTLRNWIDDMNTQNVNSPQRAESCLAIVEQIISGVKCIHDKMLIHRDLKPANILFGLDQKVKIGDFSLVTVNTYGEDRSVYTGTPFYMAPEQKDKTAYDRKVDIYALGLIYFELLWCMFTRCEREKLWNDVRSQKLPPGFSLHFPTEQLMIKSMLCSKPEDRPEASELQTKLEEYAKELHFAKEQKTV
ncbi:interferon-induced, double-stranded RNA-activated protein kinase [Hippocampus zosterae]|uniref:interferon-induced, double-stranded RNA-activated protein kinase n=1 Tax=Hippocampus zosterae TaxID=109293 RepID=UPI00223D10A6|nr:interferon-induced, double-stranded RNA-activated protein kinase [Hippocampus zosterae]XP_051935382.1 interferon-induced, double-stranded RNA-activated protein kinase [Hippocampus zosterae]